MQLALIPVINTSMGVYEKNYTDQNESADDRNRLRYSGGRRSDLRDKQCAKLVFCVAFS